MLGKVESLEQQQRETVTGQHQSSDKGQGTEQFTQLTSLTSFASAEALFRS